MRTRTPNPADGTGREIVTNPSFIALGVLVISSVLMVRLLIKRMPKPPGGKQSKGGMFGEGGPFSGMDNPGKMKIAPIRPEVAKTKFADVAGLGEAKVEIMELVEFLHSPKRFAELGTGLFSPSPPTPLPPSNHIHLNEFVELGMVFVLISDCGASRDATFPNAPCSGFKPKHTCV
jgi:hypothetical protein